MSKTRRSKEGLLARVNFPLYCVQMLTSRHVLVAGGGGSAKTGVKNGFEIFELSHDGQKFVAEEMIRHETGASVVMNCACHSDSRKSYLLAGQESHCQLYHVGMRVGTPETLDNDAGHDPKDSKVRKRHGNSTSEKGTTEKPNPKEEKKLDTNCNSYKKLEFSILPGDSIQTDFGSDETLQRVVRISNNGKMVATAGTDGHVRIWSFPILAPLQDIEAHTKEVDDLDFSPDDKLIMSISKDGAGLMWDSATGKKVCELKWDTPENVKYLFKRCRFGLVEGDVKCSHLFVLANPARRAKLSSYLQLWNPTKGSLVRTWASNESLCALAVSDDGRFAAVGSMFSGSVHIFVAFSLQQVLKVHGAHSMFVTGLAFLPSSPDGTSTVMGSCTETAVVSISVDNQVCIHSVAERGTIPSWAAILLIIAVLFLAFLFCSFLGL